MTRTVHRTFAAALLTGVALSGAAAHDTGHERGRELFRPGLVHAGHTVPTTAGDGPPLYDGLGDMTMPITAADPNAQAYYDQGIRLTWAFNHAEARRSFEEAQRLDPTCAMCFWGEAFALGPNINDGMRPEAVEPANRAMAAALALKERVSPKERALIEALAHRYGTSDADRAALNQAWADAMREVAAKYPDDADVLVFFADALMNLQPWDYWEADGRTTKGYGGEILATLEKALTLAPDHPAAAHLYIHAVEASADPARAEAVADRLRGTMPAAGHLLHMPAHIYARVGRHADSMAVNRAAIAADEAFLAQAGPAASPLYRFGYYPHNIHYLMVSAQMAGVAEDVIGSADKLASVTSDQVSQELAWVQAIKTAPYTAHAQFSNSETILALADPGDRFPFVKGFWHYARGVGYAGKGDVQAARGEARAIEHLIASADMSDLEAQFLPAKEVLGIARQLIQTRIGQAEGDYAAAEDHVREAVALQDGIAYMEPPYWYYPVRQTLGAVLLQQGRAKEAIVAFQAALKEAPRNGWALWGLLQAQIGAGDAEPVETQAAFKKVWLGDETLLDIDRL